MIPDIKNQLRNCTLSYQFITTTNFYVEQVIEWCNTYMYYEKYFVYIKQFLFSSGCTHMSIKACWTSCARIFYGYVVSFYLVLVLQNFFSKIEVIVYFLTCERDSTSVASAFSRTRLRKTMPRSQVKYDILLHPCCKSDYLYSTGGVLRALPRLATVFFPRGTSCSCSRVFRTKEFQLSFCVKRLCW